MEAYAHDLIAFVKAHQAWAAPIVLGLAFCESVAFISLLVPAWGVLVALGTMMSAGEISFWPIWLAGAVGAAPHADLPRDSACDDAIAGR